MPSTSSQLSGPAPPFTPSPNCPWPSRKAPSPYPYPISCVGLAFLGVTGEHQVRVLLLVLHLEEDVYEPHRHLESTKIIFLSTLSIIAFILPFAKCRYELNFVWVSSAKHSRPCSAFCSPRHPWLVVLTHIKIKFCDTRRTFKSGNYY